MKAKKTIADDLRVVVHPKSTQVEKERAVQSALDKLGRHINRGMPGHTSRPATIADLADHVRNTGAHGVASAPAEVEAILLGRTTAEAPSRNTQASKKTGGPL